MTRGDPRGLHLFFVYLWGAVRLPFYLAAGLVLAVFWQVRKLLAARPHDIDWGAALTVIACLIPLAFLCLLEWLREGKGTALPPNPLMQKIKRKLRIA